MSLDILSPAAEFALNHVGFSMQTVSAYQMKDRWLIHPMRRTTMGLLVGCEPFVSLPLEVEVELLGGALTSALEHAVGAVQHPTDWKQYALPRYTAAGVRSERAFQLHSLLVSVTKNSERICFQPTRNCGASSSRKGFEDLADFRIYVPIGETSAGLGTTLLQVVKKSLF